MRRQVSKLSSVLLIGVMGAAAACSGSGDSPRPATSSPAAVAKQAGADPVSTVSEIGIGFIAKSVLGGILSAGANRGAGFLMAQLNGPDATTQSLDLIKTELGQVTSRLDQIQTSLVRVEGGIVSADLNDANGEVSRLNDVVTGLYDTRYRPVVDAALTYEQAKENGLPTTAAAAILQTRKDDFGRDAAAAGLQSILRTQHSYLMPNSRMDSLLKRTGKQLMLKDFVTSFDSARLRDLYVELADEEALTAKMLLEYDLLQGDTAAFDRDAKLYQSFAGLEINNLPPQIPAMDIVDTRNRTTTGTQMYMSPVGPDGIQPLPKELWAPTTPEGVHMGPDTVAPVLAANPGWDLPTIAQLTALYSATKNAPLSTGVSSDFSGSDRLERLWWNGYGYNANADARDYSTVLARRWFHQIVWSKDMAQSNTMECGTPGRRYTRVYTLRQVASFEAKDRILTATQPGRIPDFARNLNWSDRTACDAEVRDMYSTAAFSASFILTQTSKADYMAQSTTPAAS